MRIQRVPSADIGANVSRRMVDIEAEEIVIRSTVHKTRAKIPTPA